MKVKDIMAKDIITVTPETTLKELAGIIKKKKIHGVPVLDQNGELVGIMTVSDMLGILKGLVYWGELEKIKPGLGIKDALMKEKENAVVGQNMSKAVRTIKEDDSVEKVLELMCKHNVHTIPVVKEGKIVGVVGASDIIEIFV